MASVRKRTWTTAKGESKSACCVDFVDQAGQRQRKQFSTKKAADAFRIQVEGQIAIGTYRADAAKTTVKDVAEQWLTACETRQRRGQRMEKATLEDYRGHVNRFILAAGGLAGVKLNALSGKAVRDFRDRLLDRDVSVALVRKVLATLRLVAKHAIENDILATNPVEGVEVLDDTRIKEKIAVPSKAAVKTVIDAASENFRPYVIVAALCGLRASEQRALQWGDIDFDQQVIHIRRRADRFNAVGEPKSAAGHREVPAGPMVLNVLKKHRGDRIVRPDQLVFPTKTGTVRSHATILHRDFYPIFAALDELHQQKPEDHPQVDQFRWHDLRHFAVSLWIEQGFSVKEVMTFAGHADYKMTMERYGHLFPKEDHQRGMAEIERKIFGMSS